MRYLCLLLLLPLVPFAGCSASDTTVIADQCESLARDGDETDVDCGGSVCAPCPAGRICIDDADCRTGNCDLGICRAPGPAPTCSDGALNGDETDVDCGGPGCNPCGDGGACALGTDCESGLCTNGQCDAAAASCTDGLANGDETDVDCGGGCPPCADGLACAVAADCASAACSGGACLDPASACSDGAQDGAETDLDCGGGVCPGCAGGSTCSQAGDCASGVCTNNACVG